MLSSKIDLYNYDQQHSFSKKSVVRKIQHKWNIVKTAGASKSMLALDIRRRLFTQREVLVTYQRFLENSRIERFSKLLPISDNSNTD